MKFSFERWRFPALVWVSWVATVAAVFGASKLAYGSWSLLFTYFRWDQQWYTALIAHGYTLGPIHSQANVVFFPLYPLLVQGFQAIFPLETAIAGPMVSVLCFLLALVLFYDLVATRYNVATARVATLLLAFNPFGMFFGMVYTESIFLLLTVATFWLMLRQHWWAAAIVAGLASGTRSIGVTVGLLLVLRWLYEHDAWRREGRWVRYLGEALVLGIISASGLIAFGVYLQMHNGDALAFIHVQKYWGRVGPGNLWDEFNNALMHTLNHTFPRSLIFSYAVWYGSVTAAVIGLGILVRQREWFLSAFVFLNMAIPLLSGTVGSMNRYAMVLFPLYIGLARLLRGRAGWLAVGVSVLSFVLFWLVYLHPRQLFFG